MADKAMASAVLLDIATERDRQMAVEGWTPEHDDSHDQGEFAKAAACYAVGWPLSMATEHIGRDGRPIAAPLWPWDEVWWKPGSRRRDLIRAGALVVAEIERLDRAAVAQPSSEES